jgi:hypothetical protein
MISPLLYPHLPRATGTLAREGRAQMKVLERPEVVGDLALTSVLSLGPRWSADRGREDGRSSRWCESREWEHGVCEPGVPIPYEFGSGVKCMDVLSSDPVRRTRSEK